MAVLQAGIDRRDEAAVVALADGLHIELYRESVRLDGHDVGAAIRTPEVATSIGAIADNIEIRQRLTQWQRSWTRCRRSARVRPSACSARWSMPA